MWLNSEMITEGHIRITFFTDHIYWQECQSSVVMSQTFTKGPATAYAATVEGLVWREQIRFVISIVEMRFLHNGHDNFPTYIREMPCFLGPLQLYKPSRVIEKCLDKP